MRNEIGSKIEQKETEPKIDFVREFEKRIIDSEPLEETKSIIVNNREMIKIIKNVPAIVFLFNRELELWIKDVQDVYTPHYKVEADLRSTIKTPSDAISVWCDGFIIVDNKKIRYLLIKPLSANSLNESLKRDWDREIYDILCQKYKLACIIGELRYNQFKSLPTQD